MGHKLSAIIIIAHVIWTVIIMNLELTDMLCMMTDYFMSCDWDAEDEKLKNFHLYFILKSYFWTGVFEDNLRRISMKTDYLSTLEFSMTKSNLPIKMSYFELILIVHLRQRKTIQTVRINFRTGCQDFLIFLIKFLNVFMKRHELTVKFDQKVG